MNTLMHHTTAAWRRMPASVIAPYANPHELLLVPLIKRHSIGVSTHVTVQSPLLGGSD